MTSNIDPSRSIETVIGLKKKIDDLEAAAEGMRPLFPYLPT